MSCSPYSRDSFIYTFNTDFSLKFFCCFISVYVVFAFSVQLHPAKWLDGLLVIVPIVPSVIPSMISTSVVLHLSSFSIAIAPMPRGQGSFLVFFPIVGEQDRKTVANCAGCLLVSITRL